ncbi:hypothetical protein B0H19DRAFT_1373956, partial [Mycena capillaripes]
MTNFLDLPPELILKEQDRAGIEENSTVTSSSLVSDRLEALRRREANWLNFTSSSGHTITIDFETTGVYDLASDVYIVGDTAHQDTFCTAIKYIHTSPGSGPLEWCRIDAGKPISDFGTALQEHDLIAFVTYEAVPSSPPQSSVDVQLFQFLLGLLILSLLDENLALSLVYWSNESRDMNTLHVFNWKSGIPKMAPRPIFNTGLVFLSAETLIAPNAVEATLDVFHIPTSEERTSRFSAGAHRTPAHLLAALAAPHSLLGLRMPFFFSPLRPVVQGLAPQNTFSSWTVLSSPDAPRSWPDDGEDIEWEAWGPRCTRWIDDSPLAMHYITVTSGQRLVSTLEHDPTPICIHDFNPQRVEAQRAIGPVDGDHATVRIVDDAEPPNWPEHLDAFEKPVVSRLPYIEIDSKEKFDFGAVLINDENILGVRGSVPGFSGMFSGAQHIAVTGHSLVNTTNYYTTAATVPSGKCFLAIANVLQILL